MHALAPILAALLVLPGAPARPTAGHTTAAPSARPSGIDASPTVQLHPCTTAPADASATLVPFHQSAFVSSSGIAYGAPTRDCRRFIAELHVPHDAKGPTGGLAGSTSYYNVYGALGAMPGSESACVTTKLAMHIYHKAAGKNAFALHSTAKYVGTWNANAGPLAPKCSIKLVEGGPLPQVEPNPAGAETWRLLVDASRGNTPLGVTATAAFEVIPY